MKLVADEISLDERVDRASKLVKRSMTIDKGIDLHELIMAAYNLSVVLTAHQFQGLALPKRYGFVERELNLAFLLYFVSRAEGFQIFSSSYVEDSPLAFLGSLREFRQLVSGVRVYSHRLDLDYRAKIAELERRFGDEVNAFLINKAFSDY